MLPLGKGFVPFYGLIYLFMGRSYCWIWIVGEEDEEYIPGESLTISNWRNLIGGVLMAKVYFLGNLKNGWLVNSRSTILVIISFLLSSKSRIIFTDCRLHSWRNWNRDRNETNLCDLFMRNCYKRRDYLDPFPCYYH